MQAVVAMGIGGGVMLRLRLWHLRDAHVMNVPLAESWLTVSAPDAPAGVSNFR
jgi:hypothetical protein